MSKSKESFESAAPVGSPDVFECVVAVSQNGRRYTRETQGRVLFYEDEMVLYSRSVWDVIKDLFVRSSASSPRFCERMRFSYSKIGRVYFSEQRVLRIDLSSGGSAYLIFTFISRERLLDLLSAHGIEYTPFSANTIRS